MFLLFQLSLFFVFLGYLGKIVHRNTLHNFIRNNNIGGRRSRYYNGDIEVIKEKIGQLNEQFPRSGYREIKSLLQTDDTEPYLLQREKVRKLLKEVDPIGSQLRLAIAIKRRVYSVPYPNFLWPLDTNHKLIR